MSHLIKIGANGAQLPRDAAEWSAVLDARTNIMWTKDDVVDANLSDKEAAEAVAKLNTEKFLGFSDWDMPEVEELFCISDRSRYHPAIDTDFFPSCKSDFYRSKTPYKSSSSGCAWFVNFLGGHSGSSHHDYGGRVRACRRVRSPSQ